MEKIDKWLLEHKNKIIGVWTTILEPQNFQLLDYNDKFLLVKTFGNEIYLINLDHIILIEEGQTDKFYEYMEKRKGNSDFCGDEEDKGYKFIKKIKKRDLLT